MRKLGTAILSFFIFFSQAANAADFRFSPRPNKADLIRWRQWSGDVFSDSKRLKKPVLLALSAVWCHWCHIMDETTYSDRDVIAFINDNFIPVRVDADMRPDIDSLYNQGGWPSTLVLTPEGEIARGGAYVPPEDMVPWLKKGVDAAGNYRHAAVEEKKRPGPAAEKEVTGQDLERMIGTLKAAFDSRNGGFGTTQKFPNPDATDFLLSEYTLNGEKETRDMITLTLDSMAAGRIHDDIGGGFFRYATRPDWSSPHYEKLLDLNAGLARNYSSAYLVFGKDDYRTVLEDTIVYVMNNLYDRERGVFYGSQDADEGYYAAGKREGLQPPRVDTTVYAAPNAQMITALVAASGATGSKKCLQQAEKTAGFMIRDLYSEKEGVYHYYLNDERHLPGLLADNVLFGSALIDLYDATGNKRYIHTARAEARLVASGFFDSHRGLFRTSLEKPVAAPSGVGGLAEYSRVVSNIRAAVFLLRIASYQDAPELREQAARAIARTKDDCGRMGPVAGICGTAYEWLLGEPLEIVIITSGGPERFLSAVNGIFIPRKVVKVLSLEADKAAIERIGYPLKESLYLCSGKRCFAAVAEPGKVAGEVRKYIMHLRAEKRSRLKP